MSRDGEIVGIDIPDNGHSCVVHECCGSSLLPNDLIRFKSDAIDVGGKIHSCFKAVRITDGVEGCNVGYLPLHIVSLKDSPSYKEKFATIIELYRESEDSYKYHKSQKNHGMASFRLLSDMPCHP